MYRSKIDIIAGLLAVTSIDLFNPNSIFCLAGLCEDNPGICEVVTGCYSDPYCVDDCNCNQNWWAFKPIGPYACPPEGCPLYVWIEGSAVLPYQTYPAQHMMLGMLKRGFIAVTADYENSLDGYYSHVCDGFTNKTQRIFDGDLPDSVVAQLCDGASAIANCDLGIATHGYSRGAHNAALAGNFERRVSASLLISSGNDNSVAGDLPCLDNQNIALPRERRRSIVGENDDFFGINREGVLQQQIEISGYDCDDRLSCFVHLPEGCTHGGEEQYCEANQMFYSSNCPACSNETDTMCSSDPSLVKGVCPLQEVPDTYLGGDALIEDTGGYYIFTEEEYCAYTFNPAFTVNHVTFLMAKIQGTDFLTHEKSWGLEQNLDWLARTARKTALYEASNVTRSPISMPTKSPTKPTIGSILNRPILKPKPIVFASFMKTSPNDTPAPTPKLRASKAVTEDEPI